VDAIQCVATIHAAYESAARRSVEVAVHKPTGPFFSAPASSRIDVAHREPISQP
jgi:hypothetical protein